MWRGVGPGATLPKPIYYEGVDWDIPLEDRSYEQWLELCRMEWQFPSGYIPVERRPFSAKLSIETLARELYAHIQECKSRGGSYILWGDDSYPASLRTTDSPPIGITLVGDKSLLARPSIAVVGSRKAFPRTIAFCEQLGRRFADESVVCVSGGAYGCDISVHQGMLKSPIPNVPAIVVFAHGLAYFYPQGNVATFRKILSRGGLFVSERLWNQEGKPQDFPIRNRIISGLSYCVILMQADGKSGAMTTAQRAIDQGRELLVFRYGPQDAGVSGSQQLIEEGASSFASFEELYAHLATGNIAKVC